VLGVLLRLLSEGTVRDSEGLVADVRHAIVAMTSNVLGPELEGRQIGFGGDTDGASDGPSQAELKESLAKHFPLKLLDRLDSIVVFGALSREHLTAIARCAISEGLGPDLRDYGVLADVDPEVPAWVAARVAAEEGSARDIRRCVGEHVVLPFASYLQLEDVAPGSGQWLRVHVQDGVVRVDPCEAPDDRLERLVDGE
jgi:ATP-dependent Clp protease ATP-binding subunit ClpB